MLTSQLAGNLTLASLNTPLYSPTLTPNIWSPSPHAQQECHDFQSNVSLQVSCGQTSASSMAPGLGIIYPSDQSRQWGGLHLAQRLDFGNDATYWHRPSTHTQTIYESINTSILEEPVLEPLTLSSFLDPAEFSREEFDLVNEQPVVEKRRELATSISVPESAIEEQRKWILQQILEASGHTLESLAAELAAGFQDGVPLDQSSRGRQDELQSNSAQNAFFRLRDSPLLGVNPADIMPPQPGPENVLPSPPESTDLALGDEGDMESESRPCMNIKASMTIPRHELSASPVPLTEQNLRRLDEITYSCKKEISNYEPSLSFSALSKGPAPMLDLHKPKSRTRLTKQIKRRSVKDRLISPCTMVLQSPTNGLADYASLDLPINYGTPVLDAHRGIELGELEAKAERYRLRNQCQEYDKKWLLSFAGKLTPQGQLTEEYRCYVIGCNQSNRRRDHILIHVGGHLDQRPFACTHCSARFLRKNECKRHELSHTGARPFACNMCPFGTTAFVRRDLLRRHQNRTHNIDNSRGRITKRHRRP